MKTVKISLKKNEILYDIDALTYKKTEASLQDADIKIRNAVSSDSTENLDGSIISRFADYRDSELREMLMFCLRPNPVPYADNIQEQAPSYEYRLVVDRRFDGNRLRIAAQKMHQYIVMGATYDWYINLSVTPPFSRMEIESTGEEIVGMLRGRSWRTRPMQPFGPSGHI